LARDPSVGAEVEALRHGAAEFAAVPTHARGAQDGTAARKAGACKQSLAALCARAAGVARFIAGNVATVNGIAGEPSSFDALHALIKGQVYRLAFWRVAADDINYRRFFDVNDLAALRAERNDVFEATHRRILALVAEGKADALRVDHPDGLLDPAGYCARLQAAAQRALGARAQPDPRGRSIYLVLEKILAGHEHLPIAWPVHGTTGYRFMNVVNGLFVDTAARTRFDRLYASFTGLRAPFDDVARESKALIAVHSLASDLNRLASDLTRLAKRDRHTCDFTRNALRRALVEVAACFPVYRTYAVGSSSSDEDRRFVDWAVAVAKRYSTASDTSVFDFVGATLRGDRQGDDAIAPAVHAFVARFQQFTAPVTAKGVEDTSLYVFNRLVSLNEVGGDPRAFGFTVSAFHGASQDRAQWWPHTMLATSTHDSKRGEDVRARIDVLSEMPAGWRLAQRRWAQMNRRHRSPVDGALAPSRNDEYLFYQTLLGTWPAQDAAMDDVDAAMVDALRERIQAYLQKATREAKVHTSWVNPHPGYEAALVRFVEGALAQPVRNRFVQDFRIAHRRIARHGCVNGLAQLLVKLTSPGVPDTYQGTELWDLNLVDPDNRRPVDYRQRAPWLQAMIAAGGRDATAQARELLEHWPDGRVKLWLTWRLLSLRRERATWFERAGYLPVNAVGTHAARVCAYARSGEGALLLCVVPRLWMALARDDAPWPLGAAAWADTALEVPGAPRAWRNLLTGEVVEAGAAGGAGDSTSRLALGSVLSTFPVAALA
jgi:(1->4)-alpha-D-glucan 1-alpha-D-glucosylmutase